MGLRPSRLERRRRILAAARKVFVRDGYASARMDDVAAEAKVGKGTLYQYFQGKEDLFATLVLEVARHSLEAIGRSGTAKDPAKAFRDAIALTVDAALRENLDLYRLFFDFWGAAARREDARLRLREISERFTGMMGELVREGQRVGQFRSDVDVDQLVQVLGAAIDGISLRLVVVGDKVDLDQYTRFLQQLFLTALSAEPSLGGASLLTEVREE